MHQHIVVSKMRHWFRRSTVMSTKVEENIALLPFYIMQSTKDWNETLERVDGHSNVRQTIQKLEFYYSHSWEYL